MFLQFDCECNLLTLSGGPTILGPSEWGPRRLVIFLCGKQMRFARKLLSLTVLTLYVVQLLGGQAVHRWQCASDFGRCCPDSCSTEDCCTQSHGVCTAVAGAAHCPHDHAPHVRHHGPQRHNDAPVDKRHDPVRCWICKVLGQAQAGPFTLAWDSVRAIASIPDAAASALYPSPDDYGFRVRAPPAHQVTVALSAAC